MAKRVQRRWAALAVLLAAGAGGCATYSEQVQQAHTAAVRGGYGDALRAINRTLGVSSAQELPGVWEQDTALALLERAVILQALGQYELSARDFREADQRLEILDISSDPVGRLARYVYSDAAEVYRISPPEQLALNALNMLNYLAGDNLPGAAVEARRFTVIRNYLDQVHDHRNGRLGSYLAGFVFEQLGEYDRALRHYDEALTDGALPSLRSPIQRLAGQSTYRSEHISALLAEEPPKPPAADEEYGEVLVVLALGRGPYKAPARMPIGMALGMAGAHITGNPDILTRMAGKVIVYPELVTPWNLGGAPSVYIGDQRATVELVADQAAEMRADYERIKPIVVGAALSRLIARAAAAEGVRAAARRNNESWADLAALMAELSLAAQDRPDTRSWTFLPGRVLAARTAVPPGEHVVRLYLPDGRQRAWHVTVTGGAARVIVVTAPH